MDGKTLAHTPYPPPIKRNVDIDLLKIFAIFGVIIIHVSSSKWYTTPVDTFNWQVINFYHTAIRWPIPIFVMISGMFFLRSVNEDIPFKSEMKKITGKVMRLVFALIFWGIAYNTAALAGRYLTGKPITLYDIIPFQKIVLGPAWFHLWFLYMLIGLYLLTPIFRRFIKNSSREYIEYFLILFFLAGGCLPLINKILAHIPFFRGRAVYLPLPEVSGYMGYFIAGYYFAYYDIKKKTQTLIYTAAILSLTATLLGTALISLYKKEANQYLTESLLPNTILISFAVFILFKYKISKIKFSPRHERLITGMEKNMFGVYLIHAMVIEAFDLAGVHPLLINPVVSVPVMSIIVMLVSYTGILIIRKIPAAGYII
ncbi:MAG: acyltransferase family protein [Treponema sp.]|jgi:surface polysaccharide O-acyltransferase-like enzyme|nr:acyltransferase family protein [Treponema sp.]